MRQIFKEKTPERIEDKEIDFIIKGVEAWIRDLALGAKEVPGMLMVALAKEDDEDEETKDIIRKIWQEMPTEENDDEEIVCRPCLGKFIPVDDNHDLRIWRLGRTFPITPVCVFVIAEMKRNGNGKHGGVTCMVSGVTASLVSEETTPLPPRSNEQAVMISALTPDGRSRALPIYTTRDKQGVIIRVAVRDSDWDARMHCQFPVLKEFYKGIQFRDGIRNGTIPPEAEPVIEFEDDNEGEGDDDEQQEE